MLVNELSTGEEILDLLTGSDGVTNSWSGAAASDQLSAFEALCTKARQAWALAVFSDACKETLERYFSFHMRILTGLSMKLSDLSKYPVPGCCCLPPETISNSIETALNQLTDHLFLYFGEYPDKNILVPLSYHIYIVKTLEPDISFFKQTLNSIDLPDALKSPVTGYLDHLTNTHQSAPLTFKQLNYFQAFVKEIKTLLSNPDTCNINDLFADKLLEHEFNHIAVFSYLQDVINNVVSGLPQNKRIPFLKEKADQMKLSQKEGDERYDLRWPKLSVMLLQWLSTEITVLEEKGRIRQVSSFPVNYKVKLEMSVAHLACLLRLFKKDGLFGAVQLTELFKFTCENFTTKRTETMASGGLSKAYYSITQVIAAEVKDMLLKMIQRINHDYFPVVAAIGVIIYAY